MFQTFSKRGIEGTLLIKEHLTHTHTHTTAANTKLNGEILNTFSLRSGTDKNVCSYHFHKKWFYESSPEQ